VSNGFSFERVETCRTDTTPGGVQKISDADGNPEAEYVFYAEVEGAKVPLFSKSATFVDGLVKTQQAAQQQQQQAGEQPASAGATGE
jgi:hypothetical protein